MFLLWACFQRKKFPQSTLIKLQKWKGTFFVLTFFVETLFCSLQCSSSHQFLHEVILHPFVPFEQLWFSFVLWESYRIFFGFTLQILTIRFCHFKEFWISLSLIKPVWAILNQFNSDQVRLHQIRPV